MKHWISFLSVLIIVVFVLVFAAVSCDEYKRLQGGGDDRYSTENVANQQGK